jgi:hypothetical protein
VPQHVATADLADMEPYYVVNRNYAAKYDPRRGWLRSDQAYGPNKDKLLSQVESQLLYTYMLTPFFVLPDVFILRSDSWAQSSPLWQPFADNWNKNHCNNNMRMFDMFWNSRQACEVFEFKGQVNPRWRFGPVVYTVLVVCVYMHVLYYMCNAYTCTTYVCICHVCI